MSIFFISSCLTRRVDYVDIVLGSGGVCCLCQHWWCISWNINIRTSRRSCHCTATTWDFPAFDSSPSRCWSKQTLALLSDHIFSHPRWYGFDDHIDKIRPLTAFRLLRIESLFALSCAVVGKESWSRWAFQSSHSNHPSFFPWNYTFYFRSLLFQCCVFDLKITTCPTTLSRWRCHQSPPTTCRRHPL